MKMMASVTALAALFGSVSAFAEEGNKPIDLTTTITVKNRSACSIAVAHSGSVEASVRFVKGETEADSHATVTGENATLTIEAVGGEACDVAHLKIGYKDDADSLPDSVVRGRFTKNGKGIYPMLYALREVEFTDKAGEKIPLPSTKHGLSNTSGSALNSDDLRPTVTGTLTTGIHKRKGRPIGYIAGIPVLGIAEKGLTNTALVTAFGGASTDRRYGEAPSPTIIFTGARNVTFPPDRLLRRAVIGISSVPGDGPYNLDTGLRDDSVVADDETMSFRATFTVTAD